MPECVRVKNNPPPDVQKNLSDIRHRTDGAKRRPTPDMRIRHNGAKRRPMLIWITRHSRELKCNNWLRLYGNQLLWIRNNFKTIPSENALRAHVHEFFPTLNFICNIMEKHVKEDKRKEGRYNLVHLIEKVSEFNFKNVPMETLSEDDKDSLQVKANAAIEDCHKTLWSKNKDSKDHLRAHQNEYSDPQRDT